MAQVDLRELIGLVMSAPEYKGRWELGASAKEALYVRVAESPRQAARSTVFPMANGWDLVLDFAEDGRVIGIEFA